MSSEREQRLMNKRERDRTRREAESEKKNIGKIIWQTVRLAAETDQWRQERLPRKE